MRSTIFFLFAFIASTFSVQAQKAQTLKPVLELKMPKTADDDMPGTRGASVVWHPVQKKYYAVFAGNQNYPLAVFDEKGKLLSEEDLIAMIDSRGLWYDATTKLISGNAYNEYGWFTYKLDTKGIPTDLDVIHEGMHQPDVQSVAAYNSATKKIMFVHNGYVHMYNNTGEEADSMMINWGIRKTAGSQGGGIDEEVLENYNHTSLIYTGIKGQELGFLNIAENQIELYDIQTGFMTKVVPLPESATIETTFNFAYANGIYWLFDMENRRWIGYK